MNRSQVREHGSFGSLVSESSTTDLRDPCAWWPARPAVLRARGADRRRTVRWRTDRLEPTEPASTGCAGRSHCWRSFRRWASDSGWRSRGSFESLGGRIMAGGGERLGGGDFFQFARFVKGVRHDVAAALGRQRKDQPLLLERGQHGAQGGQVGDRIHPRGAAAQLALGLGAAQAAVRPSRPARLCRRPATRTCNGGTAARGRRLALRPPRRPPATARAIPRRPRAPTSISGKRLFF